MQVNIDGYSVELDLGPQVLRLDAPEERYPKPKPSASMTALISKELVPGAALFQKAKQFDDGLYASVDLAAQRGAGRFPGKLPLLRRLVEVLASSSLNSDAVGIVCAAAQLAGIELSSACAAAAEMLLASFWADPGRSKPIGFYTWRPELEQIFRQDRMLQTLLESGEAFTPIIDALRRDDELAEAYGAYLGLVERLTNPLAHADLRGALGGRPVPTGPTAFFPASRAHETELIKKLYGAQPIPEGFSLIDELLSRIRSADIDLTPTEDSGWYDRQTHSLEPLACPDRTPEARRLRYGDNYRRDHLEVLFKAALALTRETHVKQLEYPEAGCAPFGHEKRVLVIRPQLSVEPLITCYERRAACYDFVLDLLSQIFGDDGLAMMRRIGPEGESERALGEEVEWMAALFRGAARTASRELGLDPSPGPDSTFETWRGVLDQDEDLRRDTRMMVPVFRDVFRGDKVWVFLGWEASWLSVSFEQPPGARLLEEKKGWFRRSPELRFDGTGYPTVVPVFQELYVERILNRNELRALCDRLETTEAILRALGASAT